MPKSDFKGKKKPKKVKISDLSMRERDKISDVNLRIATAKAQEKATRGRIITAEQLAAEEALKKSNQAKPKISVKVRPKVENGSTQGTSKPLPKLKPQYQGKFGHKMTREEVQEKYFKRTLDPLREQLAIMTVEANQRYKEQREMSVVSRAALEAERSLNKAGKENFFETGELFNSNQKSKRALMREFSRVSTFLADFTSTATTSETFERASTQGLFGGQWRTNGGNGYDPDRVSKEDAELVFDIYKRVLEAGGGWERVIGFFRASNIGLVDYGSEELINQIYDMVQNKDIIRIETGEDDIRGAVIARSLEIVNNMADMYAQMAVRQRSGVDYGNIESDKKAAEYRRRNYEWQLYREDLKNGRR